jgi:hypothetical protein
LQEPGLSASASFSLSNTVFLVLGGLAGGVLAYKLFKNGDVYLKSNVALTNQRYIEDEVYDTMLRRSTNPATVRENEDRIRDLVGRNKSVVIGLGDRLERNRLSPRRYRDALRAMATQFSSDLGISLA